MKCCLICIHLICAYSNKVISFTTVEFKNYRAADVVSTMEKLCAIFELGN